MGPIPKKGEISVHSCTTINVGVLPRTLKIFTRLGRATILSCINAY